MFINVIDNLYGKKNRNKRTVGEGQRVYRNILSTVTSKWKNIATSIFVWSSLKMTWIK